MLSPVLPPIDPGIELVPGSIRAVTKATETTSTDMFMVKPHEIRILDGFNIRIAGTKRYKERVEEIANSIATEGFYRDKPVVCYVAKDADDKDAYFLLDGHMRMAAIQAIIDRNGTPPERVPVLIKPPGTSMADMTVALFKTGDGLTPYEKALGVARLRGLSVDDKDIARRVGVSKRYLDELAMLLAVPEKLKKLLASDRISGTLVMQEIREKGYKVAIEDLFGAAAATSETEPVEGEKPAGKKAAGKKAAGKKSADRITKRTVDRVAKQKRAASGDTTPRPAKDGAFKYEFSAKAGDTVELSVIAPFTSLYSGDWYDLSDMPAGQARITSKIKVKLTGYRKPEAAAVDTGGL